MPQEQKIFSEQSIDPHARILAFRLFVHICDSTDLLSLEWLWVQRRYWPMNVMTCAQRSRAFVTERRVLGATDREIAKT